MQVDNDPPPFRELGRFDILGSLKRGHGVETLRARDRSGGGLVVIRASPIDRVSTGAWMRLEHDTQALAQGKRGPRALLFGRAQGYVYTARPYFDGETLAARLLRGPLSVRETLEVAHGLLAELRAAHALGVLHRDLKPGNVILGAPAIGMPVEVTLVDFGLARSERLEGRSSAESADLARYFSPEQAGLLEHAVDERSDLYALGLLLYECLSGSPPFAAGSLGEMLRLHLSAPPPPLTAREPVPQALEALVQHLLKKDPRERYQTAAGALADVAQLITQLGEGVREPEVLIGREDARSTLLEPAFVGRTKDLMRLEREIARAALGAGGLAIVEAESGGGKTRFLDELARRIVRARGWVLRGQGLDQGAQKPFQMLAGVVTEVLARALAEPAFALRLRGELSDQSDALRAAAPELAALFPSSENVDQLGAEQHGETRSLDALAALLGALGEGEAESARPAVLLLDDCQWADEPTLKLLAQLRRRASPKRLYIICAFRSEAVSDTHPLRALRPELHLSLLPLTPGELRDLAQSMAGTLPDEALRAVQELAEGSPFMASAVMRGLVESGALVPEKAGWKIEPLAMANLRASQRAATFLARRLELLPARSLELLTVGAVLGKQFEIQAVGELCGLGSAALLPAIALAQKRHIVWLRGDETCVFVHDKLRESLLGRLSAEGRAQLHKKAAVYLELQPGDRAFEIAFHFDAAGEVARALPFALTAAKAARAQFALDLAERQYRIASRGAAESDLATRLTIAEGLGDVLLLRGSYDDAEQELNQAAKQTTDVLARAKLAGKLGELAFKRGDMPTAAERLEGALGLLGRRVPRSQIGFIARVIWEIGVQAIHTFFPKTISKKPLEAETGARDLVAMRLYGRLTYLYWFQRGQIPCLWAQLRGMNLAERYPPGAELAQSYSEHSPVMTMIPLFARGERYARKSLEIRRGLGDVWGQGQSLHFLGVVLYSASRLRECADACREAVRLLQRTGDRWEVNTASWHIAFCHYRLGELRDAARWARQVFEHGQEIGDTQAAGIALGVWAKSALGQAPRDALELELARPTEDVHTTAELLTAQAITLLVGGMSGKAVEVLSRAQALIDRQGLRQEYVAAVLPWLLTALVREVESTPIWAPKLRGQRMERAKQIAGRAVKVARAYRNNLSHALRGCAEVEALLGHPEKARALLEESLAVARELEERAEEALTLRSIAQLDVAQEKPGAAEQAARADEVLRALGALPVTEDESATLSLTDRFAAVLEVGRQIATALSSEEIEGAVKRAAHTLLRAQEFRFVPLEPAAGALDLGLSPAQFVLAEEALRTRGPALSTARSDADSTGERQSVLCAPVLVRGVARALFFASHAHFSSAFGNEERQLASFIASLAGAALENTDGIGHLQRVERDLGHAEKMAALGTLAAGVAHEINNPLSYVLTNLEFAPNELRALAARTSLLGEPALAEVLEALHEAREGAERVSDIVRDLRLYSSPDEQTPLAVDVKRALEAMITLAKGEILARARVVRELGPVPLVVAQATRLGQVFLNLLINAAQAIPEESQGEQQITVVTRTDESGWAVIEIRDTGTGIPPAIRARIFDPFFTTKSVGVGTGLGLSICLGIVRSLGGDISVESALDKGSTFTVRLPPAPPGLRAHVREPTVSAASLSPLRILVIDDEPAIGASLARMLSQHTVTVELRAPAGLARLLGGESFDVVLCDLMMPEMTGVELFSELARASPAIAARVIFLTGGAVSSAGRDFLARTQNTVLPKPLVQADLIAALAKMQSAGEPP
jgi:signal transduction histidine kinase